MCLLAVLGSKASPAAADVEKIVSSVGIEADSEKLKKIIAELNGKSIDKLITQGRKKLSSMPTGGAASAAKKKQEEKDAKKEESESDDEDMGFRLFD